MKLFNLLTLFCFSLFFSNCGKKYKYVETVEGESITGGTETKDLDAKPITANSDSSAYCQAYQNYCIAQMVAIKMKSDGSQYVSTPTSFKLINEDGKDISYTTTFFNQQEREKEIHDLVFSISSQSTEITKSPVSTAVDSNTIVEQEKVIGEIRFGMDNKEVYSQLRKFEKETSKKGEEWEHLIGNYSYSRSEDLYTGWGLYSLQFIGSPIDWESYNSDVPQQVKAISDVLLRKFGAPTENIGIQERYKLEKGYSYLVKAWEIGQKRTEIRILDRGTYYTVDLRIFKPGIESTVKMLKKESEEHAAEKGKELF